MVLNQFAYFYKRKFQKVKAAIGLDDHVSPNLGLRLWQAISGAITIISIPICLTKVEQGYYYAFASLLSAQVLFELGMGQVILFSISHEYARFQSSDFKEGPPEIDAPRRFSAILVLISKWYRNAASLFATVISVFGVWFLGKKSELPFSDWIGPWIFSVIFTSINLYCGALFSSLEGMGHVSVVSVARLKQSAAGHIAMWLLLFFGVGLWAFLAVNAITAIHSILFLRRSKVLKQYLYSSNKIISAKTKSQLVSEIFTFQWRIAVSWISGYLIFNLMVPTVFAKFGAVEAGRIGLSMAVFAATLTVGLCWVNAKSSVFGALVYRQDFGKLNKTFIKNASLSIGFVALSCTGLIVLLFLFQKIGFDFSARFVDITVASQIAVLTISNSIIFSAAVYLRSHREEPMMVVSVVSGVLSFFAIYFGSSFGVKHAVSLYLGVNLIYTLPATLIVFSKYYNRQRIQC